MMTCAQTTILFPHRVTLTEHKWVTLGERRGILIDARNGEQTQSRRHAYIASLLGIPKFVVAVNKMDLEGFRESVFHSIREEFSGVLEKLGVEDAYFVPMSALTGDNVVRRSEAMPWFDGPSLLDYLETVDLAGVRTGAAFRFPVQRVIRPDQFFRGYAGQIASGSVRPGDAIVVLPSGRRTHVKSIETFEGEIERAFAPMSVTLTLEDELDISRGDLLASGDTPAQARAFDAKIVWLNEQPLDPARQYFLKHTTQTVAAQVSSIAYHVDMKTLDQLPGGPIELNASGQVRIETSRAICFDPYRENRIKGSAILIDPATNATAGAVMIEEQGAHRHDAAPLTAADRAALFGHRSSLVRVGNRERLAEMIERRLFHRGALPVIVKEWNESTARVIDSIGAIAIYVSDHAPSFALPDRDEEAADRVFDWLEERQILRSAHGLAAGEGI